MTPPKPTTAATLPSPPSPPRRPASTDRRRRYIAWGAIGLAVLLIHSVIAIWVINHRTPLDDTPIPEIPITLIPLRPVAPALPAPKPKPKPKPIVKRPPTAAHHAPRKTLAAPVTNDTPGQTAAETTQSGADDASDANTSLLPHTDVASAPPAEVDRFDPPPSVTLTYDALMNGVRNQTGELRWTNANDHYTLKVAIPILFVGTFEFTSEGAFDANGIAPSRYVEKRGRRAVYITDFQREGTPLLAFSRSGQTAPLPPGTQDRFSVMMQLAGLVRGNPQRYAQLGVTHEFTIADTDSSEIWPVQYVGNEILRYADNYLETRHFTRLPRKAGDHRRVDIWLAPALGWLPVRVKQIEPNGSEFELIFHQKENG